MAEEEENERPNKLPVEGANALAALRDLWGKTGRERDFMEHGAEESGRATMEQIIGKVGYEDLEHFAEGEATTDTHAAGQRLSAAWKRTMEREGKIVHQGTSMSDLMRGKRVEEGVKGGNQERPPWEGDED
ncbi:MAG TPA: hypothetical protein VET24_11855 [Actinomycetota bacterium]|nr:hypothetical protein [Actinomycetota bacterium]